MDKILLMNQVLIMKCLLEVVKEPVLRAELKANIAISNEVIKGSKQK